MFPFAIAFLSGDMLLQTFSQLPTQFSLVEVIITSSLLVFSLRKRFAYSYLLFAFTAGFVWSGLYAHSLLSWSLPKDLEGRPMLVTGYVASLPVKDQFGTKFTFALTEIARDKLPSIPLIKLAYRNSNQPIRAGDQWQFQVRLKQIHGSQSPGAFDFEAWALQKGLRASGYVTQGTENHLLAHSYHYPLNQLRQKLQDKIQAHLPASKTAPWLMALIIGERNGIAQEDWQVLRNTGTNHLMAIAGLHIGMMSGMAHGITVWIWRRLPVLALRFPAVQAGACAALAAAVIYSALAGFSIPTQRACIMLAVFICVLLLKRKVNAWHAWSLALMLVLLVNPLGVLTESFWLSFGTIALIIYGMSGRLAPRGLWWKWGRAQWVIGVGLIPLSLLLFQQTSLISVFANSIAIPWLAFLVLPACLFSGVFLFIWPTAGELLLRFADINLSLLWNVLSWFSHLNIASWQQAMPANFLLPVTVTGFLFLLLPAGMPGRWLALLWILPLLFYQPPKPAAGEIWLSLLDVGQGLCAVVQTEHHTLVYDAGPAYSADFNMGENIVLPYLRTIGIKTIDMLVISHGDNDHIGGAAAIMQGVKVNSLQTSVPDKFKLGTAATCLAGTAWQWDNIHFAFIYPTENNLHLTNDSSCVLRISNGSQYLLLTGDIEKYAETDLLNKSANLLPANIMIAPHHGSKTSGLTSFITAVHPQYILYATGYRNRYHFPHPGVVAAYEKIRAVQLNTAETGTVWIKIGKEKVSRVDLYRVGKKRYWMHTG